MTSPSQNSQSSSQRLSTQTLPSPESTAHQTRSSGSIKSGVVAPVTGTGSVHPAGDTWTHGSTRLKGFKDDDLLERLAYLATTEPPEGRPPLETYTTTPTAHGDIFRATPEFRRWLRSRYPGYGVGDHGAVEALGTPHQAVGGEGPLERFKKRAP